MDTQAAVINICYAILKVLIKVNGHILVVPSQWRVTTKRKESSNRSRFIYSAKTTFQGGGDGARALSALKASRKSHSYNLRENIEVYPFITDTINTLNKIALNGPFFSAIRPNQLLQVCTARTAMSHSVIRPFSVRSGKFLTVC